MLTLGLLFRVLSCVLSYCYAWCVLSGTVTISRGQQKLVALVFRWFGTGVMSVILALHEDFLYYLSLPL